MSAPLYRTGLILLCTEFYLGILFVKPLLIFMQTLESVLKQLSNDLMRI